MSVVERNAEIVSIQVGRPQPRGAPEASDPHDRPWTSAIFKHPVDGPVRVGRTNLEGDQQADLSVHGGPDKAVLAYAADHYDDWRLELDIPELTWGGFGENLTIRGQTENEVCIGDVWRAGDVEFQVSQPRQPCWKLGRRWRRADLPKRVVQTGRSGWYLRVLREGIIEAGMSMTLIDRPNPEWSVSRVATCFYDKNTPREIIEQLAMLPDLALVWRDEFAQRI